MMTVEQMEMVVAMCTFDGFSLVVHCDGFEPPYLQVHSSAPCAETGRAIDWSGRKWRLSGHMTPSEIVQTCLAAVLAAVEHEAREKFRYRRQAIFGPHFDVDKLVELCASPDAKQVRA